MIGTSRRAMLRALAWTAAPFSAAFAGPAGGDTELIRLLAYVGRLAREERASAERCPCPELDLDGWKASLRVSHEILAHRDALLLWAAALPAVTAEGQQAKILAVREWIGGYPGSTGPDSYADAEEHLAWSMLQDLLRAGVA